MNQAALSILAWFDSGHRRRVALLLLASALELLQRAVKWLVDYTFGKHALPPGLRHWLPSLGRAGHGWRHHGCASRFSCCGIEQLANVLAICCCWRAGEKTVFELRCQAFDQLQRLSLAYHDKTKVSESLYRVAYDAHAAQVCWRARSFHATVRADVDGYPRVMARIDLP